MIRSHLLTAFLATAWFLDDRVYDRLSDLLEAHALGRKAELRALDHVPLNFFDDGDEAEPVDEAAGDYIQNGIAVINLRGVLAMHADQVNGACQPQGRSYDSIVEQLQAAVDDPSVRAIVLRAETPGGAAIGCQEAYDAVVAADAVKPVHGFISGYCFSAGTYLLAGCRSVVAGSTAANTGSIGTVMATWDTSAAAEKEGYKRVVIRSGPYKALAQGGEPITDAARAELQRECNAYAGAFYDAVRAGRGLTDEQASAVLNGRTFLAAEAQRLGLIDGIAPFSTFLAGLAGNQESPMFGNKKTEKPAEAAPAVGMSKAEYAALAKQFPEALDRIAALDVEGKSGAEVEVVLLREQVAALRGQVSAKDTTHAAAIVAKDDALKALQSKHDALAGLKAGAPVDPGAAAPAAGAASTREAEWNAMSPKAKADFFDNFDAFCLARDYESKDRARGKDAAKA